MIDEQTYQAVVKDAFGALVEAEGLELQIEDTFRVRFVRGDAFLEVTYEGHRSREASVWVGRSSSVEPPLELPDVLRAAGAPEAMVRKCSTAQTSDPTVLASFAAVAADALRSHGAELLHDDERYAEALRQRSERARAYTAEVIAAPHIRRAERAWAKKDYAGVYAALAPVREALQTPYSHRLAFAEQRLEGTTGKGQPGHTD